jgi:hypothetical protein
MFYKQNAVSLTVGTVLLAFLILANGLLALRQNPEKLSTYFYSTPYGTVYVK